MLKIGFVTNDTELISKFKNIEQFDEFKISLEYKDFKNNTDILIVSDKLKGINDLLEARERELKEIKHVFYMVSKGSFSTNTKNVLDANKIVMIPPKLTATQIVNYVCVHTLDGVKNESNVIVFYGADHKVGTTMVAQTIAERISSKTDFKVFLGFLSGDPSCDYIDTSSISSIDTIKTKLMNQILNTSELMDSCINRGNLYILQGINNILDKRHYQPEHIEFLINLASKEFDLVILDSGCNTELALMISCLNSTKFRYLVTTQQASAFNNYQRMYQQILSKFDITDFMVIVNKTLNIDSLESPYQVANNYGNTLASGIPYLEYGWQCEKEKYTLTSYNDENYNNSLDKIINLITKQVKLDYKIDIKKEEGLLKRLLKK